MTGWYRCPQCEKIFNEGEEVWGIVKESRMAFCSEACMGKYGEIGRHD